MYPSQECLGQNGNAKARTQEFIFINVHFWILTGGRGVDEDLVERGVPEFRPYEAGI